MLIRGPQIVHKSPNPNYYGTVNAQSSQKDCLTRDTKSLKHVLLEVDKKPVPY